MATTWMGLLVIPLLFVGCGDDNGGTVTNIGGGGTTSSSVPGTGTSTSGSVAAGCHVEGGVTARGDEQVVVTLDEWRVEPSVQEATAGIVSFIAENIGTQPHELVVVKGDRAGSLPTDPDTGAVDEDQLPEGALIGEIEPFSPGQLCRGNFALEAGKYVLVCNIVEQEESGESESHFAEGMHNPFVVTAP